MAKNEMNFINLKINKIYFIPSYFPAGVLMDGKEWNNFINLKILLSYFASRVLMDDKEWNEFYKS